jgi:hypothetical protein
LRAKTLHRELGRTERIAEMIDRTTKRLVQFEASMASVQFAERSLEGRQITNKLAACSGQRKSAIEGASRIGGMLYEAKPGSSRFLKGFEIEGRGDLT